MYDVKYVCRIYIHTLRRTCVRKVYEHMTLILKTLHRSSYTKLFLLPIKKVLNFKFLSIKLG